MKRCDCWVHQQLRRGPVPPAPPVETEAPAAIEVQEDQEEEPDGGAGDDS